MYDATTAATIASYALSGVINSDSVSLTGGTATFSDPNVGTGKTVTAVGLGLSGPNAANYVLASASATATADITAAPVTINSGLAANSKAYDGTTTATISSNSVVLAGVQSGDAANVHLSTNGYTAAFASPAVGTGIMVTVSGLTLTGSAAGNYAFTQPTLTADITGATVTITSGLAANSKVYDGTTTGTISSNSVVLAGVQSADAANVHLSTNGYTATFASPGVGIGITVTISGLTLTGSAAGNYTLSQPALTADITGATVTITSGLAANSKVYDGTTTATISSNSVVLAGVPGLRHRQCAALDQRLLRRLRQPGGRHRHYGYGRRVDPDGQCRRQLHPHPAYLDRRHHRGDRHDHFRPGGQQQGL